MSAELALLALGGQMLIDDDFDEDEAWWQNAVNLDAKILLEFSIDTHPYNVLSAAHLYRHFEIRKTLDEMEAEHPTGTDWNAQFRFARRDIKPLAEALGLPAEGIHTRKTAVDSEYALAITLNFLAFPKRLHSDMAAIWRIERRALSDIINTTCLMILKKWYHLLFPGDIDRIRSNLHTWSTAISIKLGLDVDNGEFLPCFGFLDGTARQTTRQDGPSIIQQAMYDGHHRMHGFEYQAVTSPDGIVISLFGPVPGRLNDIWMVHKSRLQELIENEFPYEGKEGFDNYYVYADQGYMSTSSVLSGVRQPNEKQARMNRAWSDQRVSVEWTFGEIVTLWQTLDCFRMQKAQQRIVAVWYLVSVLLTNCYTCMTGKSEASQHFNVVPPSLREYLVPFSKKFRKWMQKYRPVGVRMFGDDDPDWGRDHPRYPQAMP